jgi:hypothetical protein
MSWSLLQSTVQMSGMSFVTGFVGFIGLLLWWIVRRRVRDFWLPILRVFEFPSSRLPRLILLPPPWVPFLMFLLATVSLLLWSFRPSVKVFSEFETEMSQIHVFVDLSPSVSSQLSISELTTRLVSVLEKIGPRSRVTLGTSHGSEIYEMASPKAAADLITGLGFHRGGAKLGSTVRQQVSRIGEIDQLFIVSDRDQHSWGGFQWQYLLVDADIRHVDLDSSNQRNLKPNLFIQEANYLSAPGSLTMDWDIVVSEGALNMPASGSISAKFNGDMLATGRWDIPQGQRSTTVSVSWPVSKISSSVKTPTSEHPDSRFIEWTLDVDSGDAMIMDNLFRAPISGRRDNVTIVAEPSGEMKLEDPVASLTAALEVSGYAVARYDRWPEKNGSSSFELLGKPSLMILQAGDSKSLDAWCPETQATPRDGRSDWSGTIWLIPSDTASAFDGICQCLSKSRLFQRNVACTSNMSRDVMMTSLMDLGGVQIGGEMGQVRGALGVRLPKASGSVDVAVFSVPLRPDSSSGVSWGTFPLMIRDLSRFLLSPSDPHNRIDDAGPRLWPRISDVSVLSRMASSVEALRIANETNVPIGESMLGVTPSNELPPSIGTVAGSGTHHAPNKRDSDDPGPWVHLLAAVIVGAMVFEGLWRLWVLYTGYRDRSFRRAAGLMLLMAFVGDFGSAVRAEVAIQWMSDRGSSKLTYLNLAREVAARTSIELSPQASMLKQFDSVAAASPWIWTPSPSKIASGDGLLRHDAVLWLKRGGLLVLDGETSDQQNERLMSEFKSLQSGQSGWTDIPPDHEFMRSFYLLSALPACRGRSWKIYTFDGRVAIIAVPYSLLGQLQDNPLKWSCDGSANYEQQVRIFVNLFMMALTTDYKRDQIHLPEILKRLRFP